MSKLFRISESMATSNGKKWSQTGKLFSYKRSQIAAQTKVFFSKFCLTNRIFWYPCYYPHRSRDSLSLEFRIFFLCFQRLHDFSEQKNNIYLERLIGRSGHELNLERLIGISANLILDGHICLCYG